MKPCLAGSPIELIDQILADSSRPDSNLDLSDELTRTFFRMAGKWKRIDDGYVAPEPFRELKINPPKMFKVEHHYQLLEVMNKDMQNLVLLFIARDMERIARAEGGIPI